jgi:chromosome segregation ATPase
MTQELTQWITEVRTLQQQLTEVRQERDQAYNSTANWRRLYETEARQRRQETAELRSQLQALQQQLQAPTSAQGNHQTVLDHLSQVDSIDGLQGQLEALVARCKTLGEQLEAEQAAHAQTRQSLIAALGDTFDTLKPEAALALRSRS